MLVFIFIILFLFFSILKELVAVVEKLNELARNDSDYSDSDTDIDDSLKEINCTQDEFVNKTHLPDLLSNQSIHLLDQTQSHEVRSSSFFLFNLFSPL
jgi:DNA-binding MltR family transcriptional regulator